MIDIERQWLKEIRDNTKQLKRIADKLDVISKQIAEQTEPKGATGCKQQRKPGSRIL